MESITLQIGDSIVSSGDSVGQVQFAASAESDGGASRYVIGQIYAQAEGAFNASSNPASIVISTSAADNLPASGKLKVTHEGHVLPMEDNAYDLGSSAYRFRNLYVANDVTIAGTGNFDYLIFNTGIGDVDMVAGQTNWNNEAGTLEIGLTDDVKIQVGQTVLFRVKNSTGSSLSKGQAVYASGVLGGGQIIQAAPFAADESVDEFRFIGLMTDDLANGEDGYVNHFGHIKNVDLRTSNTAVNPNAETWAVGDILYVDDGTAGGLTKTAPQDDIYVAMVLEDGQNGELFVRITDPGHINDLHDVNLNGLVDNNLMVWNSGSDYWEPASQLYYVDGYVGIGTDSPSYKLDVTMGARGYVRFNTDHSGYGGVMIQDGTNPQLYFGTSSPTDAAVISATATDLDIKNMTPSGAIKLFTNETNERMRITASGDVGIGTASPVTKLDVSGVITATGGNSNEWNESYDWVAASGGLPYVTGVGTANQVVFFNDTDSITSESNLYWDSTNNRLGIGTSSPNMLFHIDNSAGTGTGDRGFQLDGIKFNTGFSAGVAIQPTSSESVAVLIAANSSDQANSAKTIFRVTDNTYSTPWLNIVGGGNVGIGTASPSAKLDVNGSVNVANDVIVGGNVTVNGTTVTANVDTMEVEDPIITLGQASGNVITDTSLDRGLALIVSTGVTAFMGWDTSESEFSLLSSGVAANSSGNYTPGTYGDLHIGGLTATTANFSSTIDAASLGTGEDNSVVILDSDGKLRTDEIDSRVWGSSLVDGAGSANYISKWSDADTIANSLIYDNGTNVGIGTTSPSAKLHVVGASKLDTQGTGGYFQFLAYGNQVGQIRTPYRNSLYQTMQYDAGTANTAEHFFTLNNSTGNNHMLLNNTGLGIGTTSPTQRLDIRYPAGGGMALLKSTDTNDGLLFGDMAYSTSNTYQGIKHVAMTGVNDYMMISDGTHTYISAADGYDAVIGAGGNSASSQIRVKPTEVVVNDSSADRDFRVESNNNANMLFVDGGNDLVGVGTGSPARTLHAKSSSTSNPNVAVIESSDNTNNQSLLRFKDPSTSSTTNEPHIGSQGDDFVINTSNAESVRIDSNGNVGIGTNSPSYPLQVVGTAGNWTSRLTGSSTTNQSFGLDIAAGTNSSDTSLRIRKTNGTDLFKILGDGKVGIGVTTPTTQLDVSGSANFSGDVTIDGHLSAATKSFLINHPTREGHKLQYGSLESPYHGVRLTGRDKIENGWCVVKLPEYISELVRNDNNINIQITNIKHGKVLYVDDTNIANNEFTVKTDSWFNRSGLEFYWTFTAVRKDVQELQVEF